MSFVTIKRVVMGCLCAGTLVTAGCADGGGVPTSPSASAAAAAPVLAASSPRSGDFQLTKECSTYAGQAGDHCRVIASDLKAIDLGTTFTYEQAVANGVLDSDI